MKNHWKKVFLALLVLIAAGFSSYQYWKLRQERERIFLFTMDVLLALNYSTDAMNFIDPSKVEDEVEFLRLLHLAEAKLLDAKGIMERREQDTREDHRKLSTKFRQGLDDLIQEIHILRKLRKGSANFNSDLALGQAKAQTGSETIFIATINLIPIISNYKKYETKHRPIHYVLTRKQRNAVVHYIDSVFEKELEKVKKNEEEGIKKVSIFHPIYGVVGIKGFIEKGTLSFSLENRE